MGNYAYKKEQAVIHNEYRAYEKEREDKRAKALELDKLENPEKYKRRNKRAMRKVMPFIALAAAAGIKI